MFEGGRFSDEAGAYRFEKRGGLARILESTGSAEGETEVFVAYFVKSIVGPIECPSGRVRASSFSCL